MVLGPGDPPQDHAGLQLLVIQPQPPHCSLDHTLLVGFIVDGKILFVAGIRHNVKGFNIAPQHPHAERVESGDQRLGKRAAAQQMSNPLRHLRRCLVGEGDRQNRVGLHSDVLNQADDAVGNHPRFAAAGACQYQYWPIDGFYRLLLLRIEFVLKIHSFERNIFELLVIACRAICRVG